MVRVSSPRQKVGVKTIRVSSSRQGLRLGLARHVKKLGFRRLGLAPVALGLGLGVTNRGRSGYPEGCSTGNQMTHPNWAPLLIGYFLSLTTDLVHGSISSSRAICRVSISVVVDDVAALVDFQHGLEFGVGYDVHSGRQRVAEMKFYAQVSLLYQMEAGAIALVGGQVKTEEGVAVPEVAASQAVPLVVPNLTGRGEQANVAPDEEVVFEIGLERFGGYMSSVEAYGVVLGVKRILVVRTVVRVIIDAAQHQTFRQSTEE